MGQSTVHFEFRTSHLALIDAETDVVTLLGHPVEHSRSPRIHNTAFAERDVNAVYVASAVRPADLEAAVEGLRALQFLGANVTVPHKQAVLPALDAATDRARAVGAVNTIVRLEGDDGSVRLRGDNTDVAGFLAPLDERFGDALDGAPMVVLGAGGAARAAAYALLTRYRPDALTVVARRPEQAEALAGDLAPHDAADGLRVSTFDDAAPAVRGGRLVANATPVGMTPDTDATPWPEAGDFSADHVVYDLVYTPETTRLLREAGAAGAATVGGLAMLVGQAAAAFRQWTGRSFPRAAVLEALRA
jgi:shikimate dehydrogenase